MVLSHDTTFDVDIKIKLLELLCTTVSDGCRELRERGNPDGLSPVTLAGKHYRIRQTISTPDRFESSKMAKLMLAELSQGEIDSLIEPLANCGAPDELEHSIIFPM